MEEDSILNGWKKSFKKLLKENDVSKRKNEVEMNGKNKQRMEGVIHDEITLKEVRETIRRINRGEGEFDKLTS